MKDEKVREINMQMEREFGAGGMTLTNTGLGGTQITWGNTCIAHADTETLHELIYELTRLKEYVDKANGCWE